MQKDEINENPDSQGKLSNSSESFDRVHVRSRNERSSLSHRSAHPKHSQNLSQNSSSAIPIDEHEHLKFDGEEDLFAKPSEPKSKPSPRSHTRQYGRRNPFKVNPNVCYLNGQSLSRPLDVPRDILSKRWIFVAIAAVIACVILYFYFAFVVSAPQQQEKELTQILTQDLSTNPPDILDMLTLTDKKIKKSLKSTAKEGGYTIIDITSEKAKDTDMHLVKLPVGVSEEEGTAAYSEGLKKLDVINLAKILNSGWDLDVDRSQGLNISLHYADFKSSSPTEAIYQAIATEGLSRGTTSDSGEDNYGNFYSSGSIMINSIDYAWTVSSTYLKDIYSVSGIPDSATYVGIRIIKQD